MLALDRYLVVSALVLTSMLAAGRFVVSLVTGSWCADQAKKRLGERGDDDNDDNDNDPIVPTLLPDDDCEPVTSKALGRDGYFHDASDNQNCRRTVSSSNEKKRLKFSEDLVEEQLVPMLQDYPLVVRREMYWSSMDYAQIRDKQRKLIETVLQQAAEYPPGVVPPPIPGESRRGLGICCEPSTTQSRAARVRSTRRAIVEAQSEGCTSEQLAMLAEELSRWAAKNAMDVGLKDEAAIADFDFPSFARAKSEKAVVAHPSSPLRKSPPPPPPPPPTTINPVHASRRNDAAAADEDGAPGAPLEQEEEEDHLLERPTVKREDSTVARAARHTEDGLAASPQSSDGLGLASMIRNDSLGDLTLNAQHIAEEEGTAEDPSRGGAPPGEEEGDGGANDGLGIASMIRNDSLGNLASIAAS